MTTCLPCELAAAEAETLPPPEAPETETKSATWSGPIGMEGERTGDGRMIKANALRWQNLPVPLRWVEKDYGAHDGAVVVGKITGIERLSYDEANERLAASGRDPLPEDKKGASIVWGTGSHDLGSENGREAMRQVKEGMTPGVSMDLDDVVVEDEEGDNFTILEGRVRSATIVAIPAFEGARIAIDEDGVEQFNWVEDAGGLPKYIKRIAKHLQEKGKPESEAIATAVNVVKKMCATGDLNFPGAQQVNAKSRAEACAAVAEWEKKKATHSGLTLVASAAPKFPALWFSDPGLPEPTGLTVTPEGRVFGHIALWGTCHIANPGGKHVCTQPPRSATGYAYFLTGTVSTDKGEIPVGRVTMNTLHAGPRLNNIDAQHHYEHTGAVGAYVTAGEDRHGIWIAGAAHPDADLGALKAAPVSGDWRVIRGNLEMIGALSVNIPGFPVPRTQALVASGEVKSLVASGMVEVEDRAEAMSDDDIRALRARFDAMDRKDRAAALAAQVARSQALMTVRRVATALRDYSPEAREKKAESGEAMPDGSFPIANCQDLKNAVQAIGRASDPDAAKAHIKSRASALNCEDVTLPWAATETFAYNEDQWRVPKGNPEGGQWIDMPNVGIDSLGDSLGALVDGGSLNDKEASLLGGELEKAQNAGDAVKAALNSKDGDAAHAAAQEADDALSNLEAQLNQHIDNGTVSDEQAADIGEKLDAARASVATVKDSDLSLLGDDSIGGEDTGGVNEPDATDIGAGPSAEDERAWDVEASAIQNTLKGDDYKDLRAAIGERDKAKALDAITELQLDGDDSPELKDAFDRVNALPDLSESGPPPKTPPAAAPPAAAPPAAAPGSAQQQAGNKAADTASLLEAALQDAAEGDMPDADRIGAQLDTFRDAMDRLNDGIQDGNYNANDLAAAQTALQQLEAELMAMADKPGISDAQANQIGVALDNMFADLGALAAGLKGDMTPPPFARRYARQWLGRRGMKLALQH